MKKFTLAILLLGPMLGNDVSQGLAQTATPFQIIGHLETFELIDNAGTKIPNPATAPKFSRARMVVNGVDILIPNNTVITMPAAYKTPQQLFAEAKGPSSTNKESGLALNDQVPPLAAFEAAIDGNIVCNPTCLYVAGLVSFSQQSLNTSAGFIHMIDPNGVIHVGGDPNATTAQPQDVRLRLNDPEDSDITTGRYGLSNTEQFSPTRIPPPDIPDPRYPDDRFQVDQGNPTVHALTGYPMCVPRAANDPECPHKNRPLTVLTSPFHPTTNPRLRTFVMDTEPLIPPLKFANTPITPCPLCDQKKQAPFEIGDYVTYAGTLAKDATGTFLSVHTILADVGIYTKPGQDPAYVTLEGSLIGTMGPIADCANDAECQDRIVIEGFATDPSRTVNIYALDILPTQTPKVRLLHSTAKVQAVFGRFRWITGKQAGTLFDATGTVRGATRELMARIDSSGVLADGTSIPSPPAPSIANGLTPGVYIAPVGEYIFPEPTGVQGRSLPALNFQCLAFLVNGWALPDEGSPNIPPLSPWPGTTPGTLSCTN